MKETSIALREGLENPFYHKHATQHEDFITPDPIKSRDINLRTSEALQAKIANGIKIAHHPNTAAFLNKEESHIVKYIPKDDPSLEKLIKFIIYLELPLYRQTHYNPLNTSIREFLAKYLHLLMQCFILLPEN